MNRLEDRHILHTADRDVLVRWLSYYFYTHLGHGIGFVEAINRQQLLEAAREEFRNPVNEQMPLDLAEFSAVSMLPRFVLFVRLEELVNDADRILQSFDDYRDNWSAFSDLLAQEGGIYLEVSRSLDRRLLCLAQWAEGD